MLMVSSRDYPGKSMVHMLPIIDLNSNNMSCIYSTLSLIIQRLKNQPLWFKGCVRYIFSSLFCMAKWEHLWNKEKCFLFHFEARFVLKVINFYLFRYSSIMASSNTQSWNTNHILLNNLGSKHNLLSLCNITK